MKRNSPSEIPECCPLKTKCFAMDHVVRKFKTLDIKEDGSIEIRYRSDWTPSTTYIRTYKRSSRSMKLLDDDDMDHGVENPILSNLLALDRQWMEMVNRTLRGRPQQPLNKDPPGMTLAIYREPISMRREPMPILRESMYHKHVPWLKEKIPQKHENAKDGPLTN